MRLRKSEREFIDRLRDLEKQTETTDFSLLIQRYQESEQTLTSIAPPEAQIEATKGVWECAFMQLWRRGAPLDYIEQVYVRLTKLGIEEVERRLSYGRFYALALRRAGEVERARETLLSLKQVLVMQDIANEKFLVEWKVRLENELKRCDNAITSRPA